MQKSVKQTVQENSPAIEAERTQGLTLQEFIPPQISPATDADVITYLHCSAKFAEIAAAAEREALILATCEQLGITVSDEEWQAAGDVFRQEHKLWGVEETMAWLDWQRISTEEWSQGIRVGLLENKLKEHLFGANVDASYITNRDQYRRVALSQILVVDLTTAWNVVQMLREGHTSFCAVALEHSKGKLSHQNGGFVGVRYLVELMPEVAEAISNAKEGEIIGPIQSNVGFHILKVEKWFPVQLNQAVREQILDSLFEVWLRNFKNSNYQD